MKTLPLLTAFAAVLALVAPLGAVERAVVLDTKKSRIEYRVDAPFAAFTGTLIAYDCVVALDPAKTPAITRAELRFHFTDLRSNHIARDRTMRDWQNTEQFPECIFTLASLQPAGAGDRLTAKGQFLFHGQAREIAFPATVAVTKEGGVTIESDLAIDVRDYGLRPPRRFGLLKVDPVINIHVSLVGQTAVE